MTKKINLLLISICFLSFGHFKSFEIVSFLTICLRATYETVNPLMVLIFPLMVLFSPRMVPDVPPSAMEVPPNESTFPFDGNLYSGRGFLSAN